MPQLGLTMTEGSVSTWLKKPGEPIRKGEPLFSVETDKVEMEVEATVSGFVAGELLEPQKIVPVGTVIGIIVDSNDEVANVVNPAGRGAAGNGAGCGCRWYASVGSTEPRSRGRYVAAVPGQPSRKTAVEGTRSRSLRSDAGEGDQNFS